MKQLIIIFSLLLMAVIASAESNESKEQRALEQYMGCTRAMLKVQDKISNELRQATCKFIFDSRLLDLGLAHLTKVYNNMTASEVYTTNQHQK